MTKKKASKKAAKKVSKKVAKASTQEKSSVTAKKRVTKKKVTKKAGKKVAQKAAKKVTKKASPKSTGKVTGVKATAANDNLIHGIAPYQAKAKEEYMNAAQSEHFRQILVAWKRNLIEEVSRTIHLMQDENINHPDPNDRASQETDMSLELRSRDRERKLLKKIDSTITRLDNDDYGWCDRCGVEIGIRRLEARPTAELCVDCKTLNEIKERQMI